MKYRLKCIQASPINRIKSTQETTNNKPVGRPSTFATPNIRMQHLCPRKRTSPQSQTVTTKVN
eukprot:m.49805 g.49805  ORF g.49805 m.49805 type:complete len:63 (+) comp11122_c1_seq1:73-261(+)